MAKMRGKAEGVNDDGELIAGVRLGRMQEFLCREVQYAEREGSNERLFDRFGALGRLMLILVSGRRNWQSRVECRHAIRGVDSHWRSLCA
jgi:hypothetical protein